MGIAFDKRYQLVTGLRKSLRTTPPFTGPSAPASGDAQPDAPREEVDTALPPAPAPVKAAVPSEPSVSTEWPAAAPVLYREPAPAPAPQVPVEEPLKPEAGLTLFEKKPVAQLLEEDDLTATASSSAAITRMFVPPIAVTTTSSALLVPAPRKTTSAWSFAAGLILGVVGSSAAWSWISAQAVEVQAASEAPSSQILDPESKPVRSKPSPPPVKSQAPKPGGEGTTPVPPISQKLDTPPPATKKGVVIPTPKTLPATPAPPTSRNLDVPPSPLDKKGPDAAPKVSAPRAEPASNFDKWKQEQIAEFEAAFPDLHPWYNAVIEGEYRATSKIISGTHPAIGTRSPQHVALLKWLTLAPPSDTDTRRATQNTLVRLVSPKEVLDLWEPLVKAGASNTPDIQAAADVLLTVRGPKLDADQKRRVQAIIDHKAKP